MEPWISLLQTFGVAVTCLAALSFGIWRVIRWSAENVVKPIVAKHIESMTKMDGAVDALTSITTKLADRIEHMDARVGEIRQLIVRTDNITIVPQQKGASHGPGPGGG